MGNLTGTDLTNIWRYNATTGFWTLVRDCYFDNREHWLRIFRGDEPDSVFKASRVRPKKAPAWDRELRRFVTEEAQ